MEDRLDELLRRARLRKMTQSERLEQGISFIIGNANVEGFTLARGTVTVSISPDDMDTGSLDHSRNDS